jgi:hypothetical protein
MTKRQLDNVGKAIPTAIEITRKYKIYGHPDLGVLYGYYEWGNESGWRKILKGIMNGTRRRHHAKA